MRQYSLHDTTLVEVTTNTATPDLTAARTQLNLTIGVTACMAAPTTTLTLSTKAVILATAATITLEVTFQDLGPPMELRSSCKPAVQ
jgi:hypothetical protein